MAKTKRPYKRKATGKRSRPPVMDRGHVTSAERERNEMRKACMEGTRRYALALKEAGFQIVEKVEDGEAA